MWPVVTAACLAGHGRQLVGRLNGEAGIVGRITETRITRTQSFSTESALTLVTTAHPQPVGTKYTLANTNPHLYGNSDLEFSF